MNTAALPDWATLVLEAALADGVVALLLTDTERKRPLLKQ